jgi:hypothetical protein
MVENTSHNSASVVLTNLGKLLPDLEPLYKDIHAHPELSMHETRTAGIAADKLRKAGYEVTTGVGRTGVVGLLRNGEGPTVMLRADMDALPIAENTGLAYASKVSTKDEEGNDVPVGHMCGHDMHVAWLVGAATLLSEARDAWKGTVLLYLVLTHCRISQSGTISRSPDQAGGCCADAFFDERCSPTRSIRLLAQRLLQEVEKIGRIVLEPRGSIMPLAGSPAIPVAPHDFGEEAHLSLLRGNRFRADHTHHLL